MSWKVAATKKVGVKGGLEVDSWFESGECENDGVIEIGVGLKPYLQG